MDFTTLLTDLASNGVVYVALTAWLIFVIRESSYRRDELRKSHRRERATLRECAELPDEDAQNGD